MNFRVDFPSIKRNITLIHCSYKSLNIFCGKTRKKYPEQMSVTAKLTKIQPIFRWQMIPHTLCFAAIFTLDLAHAQFIFKSISLIINNPIHINNLICLVITHIQYFIFYEYKRYLLQKVHYVFKFNRK